MWHIFASGKMKFMIVLRTHVAIHEDIEHPRECSYQPTCWSSLMEMIERQVVALQDYDKFRVTDKICDASIKVGSTRVLCERAKFFFCNFN